MTDEQANELLRNNDWAKVSDARDLLQHAAHLGYCEAANELTSLRAEVEALRADAERYRYLRNREPSQVLTGRYEAAGCWIDTEDHNGVLTLVTGKDADAAIDAARNK